MVLGENVYRRYTRPTGELSISLRSVWCIRHRWADRKKRRLEDALNEVIASLILAAESEKAHRLERQRRELEWRKADQLRQEETARVHDLEQWSAAWEKCERYRPFLRAVATRFEREPMSEKLAGWYSWAQAYVQSLDPLR